MKTIAIRGRLMLTGFAIVAAILGVTTAGGYDQYSTDHGSPGDNCATCHGDFNGAAYTATDGVAWKNPGTGVLYNLHDGHRTYMLSGLCNACHSGSGRFPVPLNVSTGSSGQYLNGCLGCHGRDEGGAVSGAGLRQHHYRSGVTECIDCHGDADPASYTPVGEEVLPPNYFVDAARPNKPTNPCITTGLESAVAPSRGLDNDGNGVYDMNDAGCIASPARMSTWGWVKRQYR